MAIERKRIIEERRLHLLAWWAEFERSVWVEEAPSLDFSFCGISLRIHCFGSRREETLLFLRHYWGAFLSDRRAHPDIEISLVGLWGQHGNMHHPFWRVHEPLFAHLSLNDRMSLILNRDFSAVKDDHHRYTAFSPPIGWENTMSLDNLLLTILGEPLLERSALILHASAFVVRQGAFCFFAPSEAGKSTLVNKIWKNHSFPLLGGDRILLRLNEAGVLLAQALPIAMGEFPFDHPARTYKAYPVKVLAYLRKLGEPRVSQLGLREFFPPFLKESLAFQYPNVDFKKHLDLTLEMAKLESIQRIEFSYPKEADPWDLLNRGVYGRAEAGL